MNFQQKVIQFKIEIQIFPWFRGQNMYEDVCIIQYQQVIPVGEPGSTERNTINAKLGVNLTAGSAEEDEDVKDFC